MNMSATAVKEYCWKKICWTVWVIGWIGCSKAQHTVIISTIGPISQPNKYQHNTRSYDSTLSIYLSTIYLYSMCVCAWQTKE